MLRAGPHDGGISKEEDLVYLCLLEKGNGRVELEYFKNTCQTLLDFHSALPFPVNIVMYLRGAEGRHSKHVLARGICVVFMEGC